MKLLIIGTQETVSRIQLQMNGLSNTIETLIWTFRSGPELLGIEIKYDCIIVGFKNVGDTQELCVLIKSILSNNTTPVINYFAWYEAGIPITRIERTFLNPSKDHFDGMILGISYAFVGILAEKLNLPFCNLAISSQDLYYNLKTLEFCIIHYKHKIPNLKYLIIDLYDYTYFNYDVSLSRNIYDYLEWGGFNLDEHNLSINKHYITTMETWNDLLIKRKCQYLDLSNVDLWNGLFPDVYGYNNYEDFSNFDHIENRNKIICDEDIEKYVVETAIVKNTYEKTIKENIGYLDQLLQLAKQTWPDIKIYLITLPQYVKTREKRKNSYAPWEVQFKSVLNDLNKKHNFIYKSFYDHPMTQDNIYFHDINHLNYYGAFTFTQLINDMLENEI